LQSNSKDVLNHTEFWTFFCHLKF